MKLRLVFFLIFVVMRSVVVEASCLASYTSAIAELKTKQKANTTSSVALTLVTLIFPPSGIAKIGAYSAKGILSYDGTKRYISLSDLGDMKELIEEAGVGEGEELDFVYKVVREENPHASLQDVAQKIFNDDLNNLYCADNNLAVMKDVLLSLGVSEDLAAKRAKFLARHQAEKEAKGHQIHPIIGH